MPQSESQISPRSGVWTPWAEALCPDCHRPLADDASTLRVQARLDAGEHLYHTPTLGRCSANPGQDRRGCGAPIWLPPDVALLTRLKPHFPGAELEQTGGMCSALMIPSTPDRRGPVVIVTAMDGPVLLGRYPSYAYWQNGEDSPLPNAIIELPEDTPDEAVITRIMEALG